MVTDSAAKKPCTHALLVAVDGFLPSIVAIGLIRAWLSLQNGLGTLFETSLSSDDAFLRSMLFTVFLGLFGLLRLNDGFVRHRQAVVLAVGVASSIAYAVGLTLAGAHVVALAATVLLCASYAFMTRVWGEDNCSSDFKTIVIRLSLSFLVQYAAYSCVLVVPQGAQSVLTAAVPVAIALFLRKAAVQVGNPGAASNATLSRYKIVLLVGVVFFSCLGHGFLFLLSSKLSGTWTLGPLIVAVASLLIVRWVGSPALFRMMVCLTLLSQCLFAAPVLLSSFDADWVSVLKSFSYAGTMMLTMAIGCWVGSLGKTGGRSVCRWEFLYFAAFYLAFYVAQEIMGFFGGDKVAMLVIAFLCLLFAAIPMVSTDWSMSAPEEPVRNSRVSEEDKVAFYRKLARDKGLTPKEREVLAFLCDGYSSADVAKEFQVSKNTVRTQVQAIYQKLDVHSRDELQAYIDLAMRDRF